MSKMIKYGEGRLHLISNEDFWVYGEKRIEINKWCFEQWGYTISSHETGRWDHFYEGYVFRYESDKIEFILTWI